MVSSARFRVYYNEDIFVRWATKTTVIIITRHVTIIMWKINCKRGESRNDVKRADNQVDHDFYSQHNEMPGGKDAIQLHLSSTRLFIATIFLSRATFPRRFLAKPILHARVHEIVRSKETPPALFYKAPRFVTKCITRRTIRACETKRRRGGRALTSELKIMSSRVIRRGLKLRHSTPRHALSAER